MDATARAQVVGSESVYLLFCVAEDGGRPVQKGSAAVRFRDLLAVAAKMDAANVAEPDADELASWRRRYREENENLFREGTLLPVRFGTVFDSREAVEAFLAASYLTLRAAISRMRGKAEFDVELRWHLPEVLREIAQEEGLRGGLDSAQGSQLERGRLLFEAAERKRAKLVQDAHRRLAAVAVESCEGAPTDDSVIMTTSYLVERSAEEAFDRAMGDLGREGASYLHYKYVGPLPPYAFVPLAFAKGNFELIDRARRTLGLPERASFREIKAAYRRLSSRHHPDRSPDDAEAAQRFRAVAEAYEVLQAYCRGCEGAAVAGRDKEYSFLPAAVNKVFLVRKR